MKTDLTTIRGIDPEMLRKFKTKSVEKKMRIGEALTKAMAEWISKDKKSKDIHILLKIKKFDWGAGTEKLSEEIDRVLHE